VLGEPEGKRPLGRRRHRWENDIKMDLRELSWGGKGLIHLAQDQKQWWALMNIIMNLSVP
jgi:hypothetical protein